MTAFATVTDLEPLLGRDFTAEEQAQVEALLEAASSFLRGVIGQDVYPVTTSTYTAYPSGGREDLPQWPVVSVDAVTRDSVDVSYLYRPGFIMVDSDDPVDITFTWGLAVVPPELVRLTCVLAAQTLGAIETTGMLSAGGLSSVAIDDFKASFADGGAGAGMALTPQVEKSIRSQFGRGDVSFMEARW